MKIVLSWLREYCAWTWSEEELIEKLTMSGTEVESVYHTGFSGDAGTFVAVRIDSALPHPNADRLSVCLVNDGKGQRQIVCGAKNFKVGDIVPCALPGAVMPAGFEIKDSKMRGERSSGMLCSGTELGLPQQEDGLLILGAEVQPGTPLRELFQGETVLEVEVTPNRADLLSYQGLARELVALGAVPVARPESPVLARRGQGAWKLDIQDRELCPRYTVAAFEQVRVAESPAWLQEKLRAMGLRPVNNVVDITNLVLFETGQPLHAFDAARLKGDTLSVRLAGEKESILALDGKSYELSGNDLVIADAEGPVAIAGVMGGELSSVGEATTRLVLESAQFKAGRVRQTSRRLGLMSDSSYRFERGIDPQAVDRAAGPGCYFVAGIGRSAFAGRGDPVRRGLRARATGGVEAGRGGEGFGV
ncbi:MAG: phenylalanine--tRNA ligase subunit beta [Blastochloris sp.]|nr:phenylalanine--tRNA ligase subunit beta [Blastochloris sp.]